MPANMRCQQSGTSVRDPFCHRSSSIFSKYQIKVPSPRSCEGDIGCNWNNSCVEKSNHVNWVGYD